MKSLKKQYGAKRGEDIYYKMEAEGKVGKKKKSRKKATKRRSTK